MRILSKLSGKYDPVAIIALPLLLIPLAIYTEGAVRIILGLTFVLFFPGYTLIAALFPEKDSNGRSSIKNRIIAFKRVFAEAIPRT